MAGPSIAHWSWYRRPDITIQNGVLVDGNPRQAVFYYPGKHIEAILSAIQLVKDEETVKQFVNDWGMLGLEYKDNKRRSDMFRGAVDYALGIRGKTYDDYEDYKEIVQGILRHFGVKGLQDLTQPRETAQDIIGFAGRIRNISRIKLLLSLYLEDPYMAERESKAWLSGLTGEAFQEIIGYGCDMDSLKEGHNEGPKIPFYQYVLEVGLYNHRSRLSSFSQQRGIWIEIFTSPIYGRHQGFPVIQFDSLFRFIEYVLLADPAPLPQRCADPKCRQLFFPSRTGQEYCPPPPAVKRSRCQGRYNKAKERARKKKDPDSKH